MGNPLLYILLSLDGPELPEGLLVLLLALDALLGGLRVRRCRRRRRLRGRFGVVVGRPEEGEGRLAAALSLGRRREVPQEVEQHLGEIRIRLLMELQ